MRDAQEQLYVDANVDAKQSIKDRVQRNTLNHTMLCEAKELLKEAYEYIDNTHGYNSQLFRDIREFLDKSKNV